MNNIREVILKPKDFWEEQKQVETLNKWFLFSYFFSLLFFVALAAFIGELFKSTYFYAGYALLKSFREIILFTLLYFISVFFASELMKTFGGERNLKLAHKLVLFSLTPILLVSVLTGLFPFLYVIDALGLYSCYIFWLGAKELLVLPENKIQKYIMITILVNFFVFSFLSIFLSKLLTAYI